MAELVRTRCEGSSSEEEKILAELSALLRKQVTAVRAEVRRNLDETSAILAELRARRKTASAERRA